MDAGGCDAKCIGEMDESTDCIALSSCRIGDSIMDELSFGRYGWTCTLAVLSPEAGAARNDDGMALVTG